MLIILGMPTNLWGEGEAILYTFYVFNGVPHTNLTKSL